MANLLCTYTVHNRGHTGLLLGCWFLLLIDDSKTQAGYQPQFNSWSTNCFMMFYEVPNRYSQWLTVVLHLQALIIRQHQPFSTNNHWLSLLFVSTAYVPSEKSFMFRYHKASTKIWATRIRHDQMLANYYQVTNLLATMIHQDPLWSNFIAHS